MSIRIEDLAKMDFRSVKVGGGMRIAPTSPGEMLREGFLKPMGLSNYRLPKEIDVPARRIGDIIAGKRASRRIRICGCVASLDSQTAGGCAFKATMTRASRAGLVKKLPKIKPWSTRLEANTS